MSLRLHRLAGTAERTDETPTDSHHRLAARGGCAVSAGGMAFFRAQDEVGIQMNIVPGSDLY